MTAIVEVHIYIVPQHAYLALVSSAALGEPYRHVGPVGALNADASAVLPRSKLLDGCKPRSGTGVCSPEGALAMCVGHVPGMAGCATPTARWDPCSSGRFVDSYLFGSDVRPLPAG